MMKIAEFFDRMQKVDRRYIFILIAIAIILPFLTVFDQKIYTTEPVENLYQKIDSYAGREDRAVLLVFFHDASTMPELFPMEVSIIRHCFERDIKIFTVCYQPQAAPLVDYAINTVKEEYPHVQSGVHYLNFGFKPGALYIPIMLGMGDNIAEAMEVDSEGRDVANLPIMKDIKNYTEMNLVIETSGSTPAMSWVNYARSRFGVNVAAGVTAVVASDAYPYLQTGQLVGLLGGLKAAAEYEKLVDVFASKGIEFSKEVIEQTQVSITDGKIPYNFKIARVGMNAQTVAHLVIILFIILGNVGYFLGKKKKR